MTITARLRSWSGFVFPAAFALFWNSITTVFVLIAIAGLYTNLVGPLPEWFPAPALNDGKPEMNGGPMDLRTSLFLCLFLLPFVMIGLGMAGAALMNLFGRVEVVIDEFDSYVATGFGVLRWKQGFDPRDVHFVGFSSTPWQSEGSSHNRIRIEGGRTITFGSFLKLDRLEWLRAVLWQLLSPHEHAHQRTTLPALPWLSRKPLSRS